MWEIKGKDNQLKATINSLEYNGEWMGESYVTVTVESPAPVNFEIGDYIIYRDERFEINYNPGKIKSAPRYEKGDAFKYENIKFNSLADELTRCDFLDIVLNDNQLHFTGLPKFSFYGGVKDLANRMQANLDRTYGKGSWSVVVSPEFQSTKELNVQVDNIKVQGALEILVNQFETYYTISGRTITIGAAGIPAGHLFKYGKGNGLYEIEQNAEADQAIVTRVRAYGSTRNLPHRYYNSLSGADGQKLIPDNMAVQNLMLPEFPYTTQDPYIDSPNIAKLGIREGTVFFDGSGELEEIYPSIEGMTAEQLKAAGVPCNSTGALDEIVSAEQMTDNGVGEINEGETQTTAKPPTFKVTLKDLGFDINDHKTTETATISFKTGMLGGRDFEIVGCKKIESGGKVTGYELELNRVYDDGIKLWFPYSAYNAKAGDKFVLLYIKMPEVYIKAAAQRLKEAATEWLSKNDYSRSIYAPKVDEIFMARQHDLAMASGGKIKSLHDTLKEGMLLLFEDEDLNIDASIFIDRLTIKEEGTVPTYEVVLKEEKTVGRLDKMQNQIDSLAAGKGQGGGGYTAAQIRSMIEAYGDTRFLSKLKDDRSQGQIASDKAFEVGDFLAGVSGAKIGKDAETGQTFGEMDRLFVRVKAYFDTLTIINAESLAGEQRIAPGGGVKCTSVEELDDAYRCYFLSEQDGEKTETKIIAGDQAIAQMFNAKTGTSNKVSNHRYWRLVTAVSNDAYADNSGNRYGYIDLSKTDCEKGSDIPQAGDTIVQFGNRTDRTRQSAMVFSTVDADAPSIKLFAGIDSYTIADKDIISYGYDPVKGNAYFNCYGDTYIGDRDGTTFIKYDRATKTLDVKARISVTSTIGGTNINDFVNNAAQSAADKAKAELQANIDILQNQVDGVIESFNGFGAPTLTNYPANEWTADAERSRHDRDIYTDITPYVDDATTPTSGQSWKWYYNSPTDYGWVKIADSDAVKALQLATMSVRDTDVLYISHASPLQQDAPALPAVSPDGVITDSKGWQTKAPEWQDGRYIWQTTYVRRGDGSASFSDPTCIQGADGRPARRIYLRGTQMNHTGAPQLKVDGAYIYNSASGRGVRLVTLDRQTLAKVDDTTYDTYNSPANRASLAARLESLDDSVFVTLTSWDAIGMDAALNAALNRFGGMFSDVFGGDRRALAFIGYKGLGQGYAQCVMDKSAGMAASAYAEVSVYVADGMFTTSKTAVGIDRITEQYYLSTSRTQLQGGSWSDTRQPWVAGRFYWTRTKITYTDGSVAYKGEICATGEAGADAPNLLQRFSATGGAYASEWHPSYLDGDVWMQTSADGGATWSARMPVGRGGYSANLLEGTSDEWHEFALGMYAFMYAHIPLSDLGLEAGDMFTFSVDYRTGPSGKGLRVGVEAYNSEADRVLVARGNTVRDGEGRAWCSGTVPSGYAELRLRLENADAAINTMSTEEYRGLKLEKGNNPNPVWTPAAGEMVGRDGQWQKFQWAKGTDATKEPTGGWSDTPVSALPGEYVWMRSGTVVPPAAER